MLQPDKAPQLYPELAVHVRSGVYCTSTVHPQPPFPPFLLSDFDLPFLGLLHHIWTPFYNFLLCCLSSYHVSNENGAQNQARAERRIQINGRFDWTRADQLFLIQFLSDFRENATSERFQIVLGQMFFASARCNVGTNSWQSLLSTSL